MKILLNNRILHETLRPFKNIGFVPTMGGIHKGHISLIKKSIKFSKKTIVSIFVNPKQFNNINDFKSYPSNIKKDLDILKKIKKIDFIYIPKFEDIYDNKKISFIKIENKNKILCAKFRKGHFEGVLDIMDRLTSLIKPKKIFMGEKDYQQLHLVKNFIEKKYSSKIISCKTIRDKNKLALSSRNLLLKEKELIIAGKIAQSLFNLKKLLKNKNNIKDIIDTIKNDLMNFYSIKIEYLELRNKKNLTISEKIKNSKIFIAYYLNKIRLIDNF